jgi:hypothetical protein
MSEKIDIARLYRARRFLAVGYPTERLPVSILHEAYTSHKS